MNSYELLLDDSRVVTVDAADIAAAIRAGYALGATSVQLLCIIDRTPQTALAFG